MDVFAELRRSCNACTDENVTPSILVFARFVFVRFALVKFAFERFTPDKSAFVRFADEKFTELQF